MDYASPSHATDDIDHMLRSAICLNLHLGLRPGELAGLKWTDRNGGIGVRNSRSRSQAGREIFEGTSVRRYVEGAPKTANGLRDVALSPAADALWAQLRTSQKVTGLKGYLFAVNGVPVESEAISVRFAELQEAFLAENPEVRRLRFYDTRHVAVTLWLKAGIDTATVSRMAGHSSFAFTIDTYREVLPSDLSDAAVKMGSLFGSTG